MTVREGKGAQGKIIGRKRDSRRQRKFHLLCYYWALPGLTISFTCKQEDGGIVSFYDSCTFGSVSMTGAHRVLTVRKRHFFFWCSKTLQSPMKGASFLVSSLSWCEMWNLSIHLCFHLFLAQGLGRMQVFLNRIITDKVLTGNSCSLAIGQKWVCFP